MQEVLTSINWGDELRTISSNDSFDLFHDKLMDILNTISPPRLIKSKRNGIKKNSVD